MKLIPMQQGGDLRSEIKKRFSEFNQSGPMTPGRHYPRELKKLACQGAAEGLTVEDFCQLAGVSKVTAQGWWAKGVPATAKRSRRLAVVDDRPASVSTASVVVRLPSGVTIELADRCALNSSLLSALAVLEVRHAASR